MVDLFKPTEMLESDQWQCLYVLGKKTILITD